MNIGAEFICPSGTVLLTEGDYQALEKRIAQQEAQIKQQGLTIKRLLEEARFNGV